MNRALKQRAEDARTASVALHPAVDDGISQPTAAPAGATLRCCCASDQVVAEVSRPVHHNHLCGCSRCWKAAGALLAQTAVVSSDGFRVVAGARKLAVVDPSQSVRRHACQGCGAHLFGDVDDPDHHFYGLCFIHPELADAPCCAAPEFAGFVSSVVETGTHPALMAAVRGRLAALGIPAYDAFSPEIMDIIAWHRRKLAAHPRPTT